MFNDATAGACMRCESPCGEGVCSRSRIALDLDYHIPQKTIVRYPSSSRSRQEDARQMCWVCDAIAFEREDKAKAYVVGVQATGNARDEDDASDASDGMCVQPALLELGSPEQPHV